MTRLTVTVDVLSTTKLPDGLTLYEYDGASEGMPNRLHHYVGFELKDDSGNRSGRQWVRKTTRNNTEVFDLEKHVLQTLRAWLKSAREKGNK